MTQIQKMIALPILALTMIVGGALLGYAQLSNAETGIGMLGMRDRGNGVYGEITKIDGDIITLLGKNNTTYTVDTRDAEVKKFEAGVGPIDSSLDALAVDDMIGIRGTVKGTLVDATTIFSGHPGKGMKGHHGGRGVMGEVTAVDGNTLTVVGMDGTSYTVNARGATIMRMVEGTLSEVVVGDRIGVHGTKDGTTIEAKHIMDDIKEIESNEGE